MADNRMRHAPEAMVRPIPFVTDRDHDICSSWARTDQIERDRLEVLRKDQFWLGVGLMLGSAVGMVLIIAKLVVWWWSL
jgi:hypothetical protein